MRGTTPAELGRARGRGLGLFARTIAVAGLALLFVSSPAPGARAHTFHASLAEVEHNAAEKRVEIAIRLFADDLEAALSRETGRRVRLDATPSVDAAILSYLAKHFVVTGADGAPLRLEWVGKELTVGTVWVYVQAAAPSGIVGARMRYDVFFELFDDQLNSVNLKDGSRIWTLHFTPGETEKPIGG